MKVVEIRDQEGWKQLEPVWNPLLASSASATTFLTWEWMTSWWKAYGNALDLRILTAVDAGGTIRGIAPLRRQEFRRYGLKVAALSFVGDGSNDSDYLDFIIERGFEDAAIRAFFTHCGPDLARGVMLQLNDIPESSPNLAVLRSLVDASHLGVERAIPCAVTRLPASWDDYLATLRPRFRTKIRSVLKNLQGRPDVRFGICSREDELERLLPILFDLHTRRWNQDGKPGVFGSVEKRQFYFDISRALLKNGTLRFSWLEWNGRVLACQFGFCHGSTYLHLQEGYEPDADHWNVGLGLRAWTIVEFVRQGIREYDFLAGVGRHKTDWGAEIKESRGVSVAARKYKNLVYSYGPGFEERLKTAVKPLVPKRLLAARHNRAAAPGTSQAPQPPSSAALRRAAKFYFLLGGPAATRPVRERYRSSLPKSGSGRRSWAKRRQPTGRIIYYHRVNDDGDPFFPSTPVHVFERQMRFLARHHNVVSLAGLVAHLESDSPETRLAITFDDGYRDNYEHAYPILENYGLSATIFLTTGSLDSRDPLWFEVLSGALKMSAREFLDLELDLPRRFWLRTQDERLRANGTLFKLLRQLPDGERRLRLDQILRELAAPQAAARTDMMLSWDQVRFLKKHRIDFGGHTVTHPYLSRLTTEGLVWEVSECKRRIEAELQEAVRHFAYPNGREEDFAPENKLILRNAGYEAAVTTLWGLNYQSTDRMELRRGGAWDDDEALFAYRMDWYHLAND